MKERVGKYHQQIEWVLGVIVVVVSLVAWISERQPAASAIDIYDLFPLFGLLAFGLMWTHFVMGAWRRFAGVELPETNAYKTISMGLVLGLLVLHPVLLWVGLYDDGYGLPPQSHVKAYESQITFLALGSLGLTIFLAFELKRWFSEKKWWKYIEFAQIIAMAAIFVHAIELGNELNQTWFMVVWWFYGITLALAVVYSRLISKTKEGSDGKRKQT